MTLETGKNDVSGSTVIDENKGLGRFALKLQEERVAGVETSMVNLKNQVEGLEGLDSDFTSMGEEFRVALNTLSGDLKREIHDLRDSFMGEIMKIREEFGEEVSTLHQVIEGLQADMALCKRSLASGDGNTNHGPKTDVLKPSPFVGKREARAFLDGLQGWTKTELERRRVQDLCTAIAHAETLIDFSTGRNRLSQKIERTCDCPKKASLNGLSAHKDKEASDGGCMGSIRILNAIKAKTEVLKVVGKGLQYVEATINGVKVRALVDSDATHNFVADDEAKRLGINAMKGRETIKAVNSLAKAIHRVAKDVRAKIEEWDGTIDLLVVLMDDFKVLFGLEFLDKVRAFPMPFANSLCILDGGKTCMVSTEWDAKSGVKTLSVKQFKKGLNKSKPCYLAMTRLADKGSSKVEVPKVIERVLDEFKDVMPKELPKKLPPRREVDHTIKLETGFKSSAKAPYRMPPPELKELRKQLKELMDAGYIRPLKGPYGVPVLFQRKKDGSLRMCIDYQKLNKVTIKNKYPILLIADLFDQLGKARYFTKMDLRSGYYQVRIAKEDEAKTTCFTQYGSYEFLVMSFGLTNAPATFCTLMNKLFHMFLDKFVVVLRDNELYVKLEKCSFTQDKAEFLGHKIKDRGLMMADVKIKAIQDWEPPTKVAKLRSFLGLVNYYRRFIMGYSAIASSLTDLLNKNKAWIWDEECQAMSESLKKAVMEEPVLKLPDVTMPFELHTDALNFAIGGVLMQNGHPIAFERWKLNETERKYTVQEKEITAVIHCLRIWRHYLLGSRFAIKMDNFSMSYFQTQKKLSPKQAHWQDFLAEFDYQLEYKLRKANVVANVLSHNAEFAAITQAQFFLQGRIKEGLEHDPLAKMIIALAKDKSTRRFWVKGDMLFTKGDRLYVPK
nr:uncharacterized protein [Tanacetum cinerariifolium]